MSPEDLQPLVNRVAERSLEWDMETANEWEKACVIDGLLALDLKETEAEAILDRAIRTQTSAGQFAYGSLDPADPDKWSADWPIGGYKAIADPASIGHGVLELYDRTGDDRYLEAARRQYEHLRSVERSEEGAIPQQRGEITLAVDGLWMFCPFLARYGAITGDTEAVDDAVQQFEIQRKHLFDDRTGLFRHTWKESPNSFVQSTFWARGHGWALDALIDTLEYIPDHPDRDRLEDLFVEAATALLEYQDRTGYWHNIIDDPEEPLETTGTLMFAYAFRKGLDRGLLDDDRFREAARDAMDICRGVVDEDGNVRRAATVPGGPNAPIGVTLHGQGLFLLAASRFID